RWSPDGRWLVFTGTARDTRQPMIFVIGIDQDTGRITSEAGAIIVRGAQATISHAEWLPDNETVAVIGREEPGRYVIFTIARNGGDAHVVHRFASEHNWPGLAVSPRGSDVAFVAPASDGFYQLFRMPIGGGAATQVTSDPSNKTQPAWSPDGDRI